MPSYVPSAPADTPAEYYFVIISEDSANEIIGEQIAGIREKLPAVMEEATLSEVDRRLLSQRMFLNPAVFESVDCSG